MSQVLVREVPESTVASIKRMASRNGRSMAEELRLILQQAVLVESDFELPTPIVLKSRPAKPVSAKLLDDRR
ncbi:MAG: hypothetical protein KGN80_02065 [Acidobacteriota bacterium]|nr:hypothetical protein [Acidobacteriota bacterium]